MAIDLSEFVAAAAIAEGQELERLCVEAMMLQDFDKLEQLTVVYQDGHAPAVASLT